MKYKCGDCKWLNGEVTSVGIRCLNKNRKMVARGRLHTNELKYPSTPACSSGFELKEKSDVKIRPCNIK